MDSWVYTGRLSYMKNAIDDFKLKVDNYKKSKEDSLRALKNREEDLLRHKY